MKGIQMTCLVIGISYYYNNNQVLLEVVIPKENNVDSIPTQEMVFY